MGVAGTVSHPADNGVRVNGNGIAGLDVAERNGVAVGKYGDIGAVSFPG